MASRLLLALLLAAPQASGWLLAPPPLLRRRQGERAARPSVMLAKDVRTLTLTLKGCSNGVGVGLDKDNCVDMLKPGMPASKELQMGDKVVSWNGVMMVEEKEGRMQPRKLKDVVTPADSHTLVIEREQKDWDTTSWESSGYSQTNWAKNSWES